MPELEHLRVLRTARLRTRDVTLATANLVGLLEQAGERHAAAT